MLSWRANTQERKPPQVFILLVNRRWKWNISLDMFTKWENLWMGRREVADIKQIEILFMEILIFFSVRFPMPTSKVSAVTQKVNFIGCRNWPPSIGPDTSWYSLEHNRNFIEFLRLFSGCRDREFVAFETVQYLNIALAHSLAPANLWQAVFNQVFYRRP